MVGCALWFLNYSTWDGVHGIYLEDLFVRADHRGSGLGRALLVELAAECERQGYSRLQWWVLDWNTPAIEFYRSLGAEAMDEWVVYRVSGDPLRTLAGRPRGSDELRRPCRAVLVHVSAIRSAPRRSRPDGRCAGAPARSHVVRASPPRRSRWDPMNSSRHDDLVTALRQAARGLAGRRSIRDLEETLGQIVASAVDHHPRGGRGQHLDHRARPHRDPPPHERGDRQARRHPERAERGPLHHRDRGPARGRDRGRAATSPATTPSGGRGSPRTRSRPATGR